MRRRPLVVAFAVFAALLAASALPVGALQTNTAVGSNHTTATDFNNATTLTNITVQGSGSEASAILDYVYNPLVTEGDGTADNDVSFVGDSGTGRLNTSVRLNPDTSFEIDEIRPNVATVEGSDYGFVVDIYIVQENPDTTYGEGTLVVDDWDPDFSTGRQNIPLDSSFSVNADTNYTIEFVTQSDDGDATNDRLLIDADTSTGWPNGYATDSNVLDYAIDIEAAGDAATQGTYISQTHSVDNAETGFTNLTLSNAEAIVTWLADTDGDGTFETEAASSTFTTTANHTIDISGTDSTDWRVNVTFVNQSGNGEPTADLHDEGVLFPNHEPEVNNVSATPTGQLSSSTPTLQIPINDTEFPLAQSDQVDVDFYVDGNIVGTDTLTSNGTASYTLVGGEALSGGDHTWNVTASDSYGLKNKSQTFTISVPANLTIREELSPHGAITDANATILFYETVDDNPTIINRSVDANGNVSMDGLPVGSEFAVRVEAPGHYNRTVLITDLFTQSNVFLLDKTANADTITFTIEDTTGEFTGEDASIEVQRAINQSKYNSGGFAFLTIAGDKTGAANEFTTQLETGERYRLKVSNGDGDTRILGGYTTLGDDTVTLRPTAPTINVTDTETLAWNVTYTNTSSGGTISFEFNDPDDNTTDLDVYIYEQGNQSNSFPVQTAAGPHGYVKITQALAESEAAKNWVVQWNATKGGEELTGEKVIGQKIETVISELDPIWRNAIATLIVILTGGLFSVVNVRAGAVVTSFVGGGFWVAGWLPAAAGGAILVALFIAILYKAAGDRI